MAALPPLRRLATRWWGQAAFLALFLVYVLNAWTPSHYGQAAQSLGIANAGPVFGVARAIRTDEWAVTTPYFQIAVANNLGPIDAHSPFKEPLKTFFALPSRDWSMVFKPDLWGFLLLDPAHAFSLHYAILAAAFLGGFAILLRQLGCSPGFAVAGSATLFLSQFVQAWWTSNASIFAWAPWPVVAFLWRTPWYLRTLAIAYGVSVWLIGGLYPPFIIGSALAFGVLVAAFRPDTMQLGRLVPSLAAAAAGAGVAWLHFADLIPVMAGTVYPGHRISDGGGLPALQLLAHVFPNLVSAGYEPLDLWESNACEIAVVGSFLPLAAAIFVDHGRMFLWAKAHQRTLFVWLAGLALLSAWILFPIPAHFAPLINLVPGYRMLWAFGLVLLLGLVVASDAVPWVLSRTRVAVFLSLVVASWIISKLILSHAPLVFAQFDLLSAEILIWLLLVRRRFPSLLPPRRLVLLAIVVTSALTFGQFNPVQSAFPIFERRSSPLLDTLRAYAAANPRSWAVTSGWYGANLNGAGVPAINHTLLQPELKMFRRAYPDLAPAAFNEVFNRYEHLTLTVQWEPSILNPDAVALPPDPFAIPLPVVITTRAPADRPALGAVDHVGVVRLSDRRWGVTVRGWAPWVGVDGGQRLQVALAPEVGRIITASAFRLPRPDVVEARKDPSAFAAGYGLRMQIETAGALESLPIEALSIVPVDAGPSRSVPAKERKTQRTAETDVMPMRDDAFRDRVQRR